MADLKTTLRELGVIYGFKLCYNHKDKNHITSTPIEFYNECKSILNSNLEQEKKFFELSSFNEEQLNILNNSYELSFLIYTKLFTDIDCFPNISWLGGNIDNSPKDLQIGEHYFSLKEDSYILENMGLYKYLNLMTNSNFEKGLHIFKQFSNLEFEDWFLYTWKSLLKTNKDWRYTNKNYTSKIKFNENDIIFEHSKKISILPKRELSSTEFEKLTTSITREKVFSKWISENLKNDKQYLFYKKHCSETAGKNLCSYVNKNINHNNIQRFLQIYNFDYYYAKSNNKVTKLFRVPNSSEFENDYKIENIKYEVPDSQLNIYTTILNTVTNKKLVFRNECRYSHGQLNGTPEAKMYYPNKTDLSEIYIEL